MRNYQKTDIGRNKRIYALYKQKKTLTEIAKQYKLTRERVRQIVKKLSTEATT